MTRNNFHTSTNTGGPHDNFISAEDSMFEASFDDENTGQSAFGTEFYNEPLDNYDWDTDRSFAPQVISPSSLSSFTTPRKAIKNTFGEKHINNDPSPRIVTDQTPFRNKFASAALVSQQQNATAKAQLSTNRNLFHSQEEAVLPNQSFESALSEKSAGPLSPNDDSYVSFGNQSVFSDITESEMSASMTHASIDLRRRARESKKSTSPSQQSRKSTAGNPRQQLFNVHEEADVSGEIIPDNRRLDYSKSEELGSENGKKISKRLASFFANRSLSSFQPTNTHDEAEKESGDGNLIGRSLSVPRERSITKQSSPSRSDHSGSSGGFVGWPGTLDQNGNTVEDTSSFTSAEDIVSPAQALSRRHVSFADKMAAQREKESLARENANVRSPTPRTGTHIRNTEKTNIPQKSTNLAVNSIRSRVAELKRQFEGEKDAVEDVVDLDIEPTSNARDVVDLDDKPDEKETKPSDYHLAAVLARAGASPVRTRLNASYDESTEMDQSIGPETNNLNQSFPGALGRGSSPIPERPVEQRRVAISTKFDTSASLRRVQSAGKRISGLTRNKTQKYAFGSSFRSNQTGGVRLSEAALRQQDRLSSSFQAVAHGANVKGYRGFINKTAEVPNLMDDDSVTSASTMATNRQYETTDDESDVFDGVSSDQSDNNNTQGMIVKKGTIMRQGQDLHVPKQTPEKDTGTIRMNIVNIKNSISSIQTTPEAFENRRTSAEFDSALTESDTDYAPSSHRRINRPSSNSIIPGHYDNILTQKRIADGSSDSAQDHTDSESQDSFKGTRTRTKSYDLSKFAVEPSQVRKLVKTYRNMSQLSTNNSSIPLEEDEGKKAFALFEMRSRIMETDIERGFERAGGTVTVDDIVLTSFHKASCRVRDAVIVSKAWRDGASPQDARTALNLTRSYEYFVRRSSLLILSTDSMVSDYQESVDSSGSHLHVSRERVRWIDDTEFSLIRCFGPKTLRGFSIFTAGDCRSMLLKLTYEHCENLKQDLNDASSRQLVAEQLMKNEGSDSFAMTDAELDYLESMEDVKVLAKRLVKGEQAFDMVRAEIETQVQKLEHILERIDNDSADISSYDSAAGSDIGDDESDTSGESQYEKERLARRVQKAELNAEVALREAQIAKAEAEKSKQEAERIRLQKEKELEDLQAKLEDLEAKSSVMLSDFEAKLRSQSLFSKKLVSPNDDSFEAATSHQSLLYAASSVGTDPDQNEAKERIKAKFRQRRTEGRQKPGQENGINGKNTLGRQKLSGQVHQRLEFYGRSLQAVGV